jgi:hypothetical protein
VKRAAPKIRFRLLCKYLPAFLVGVFLLQNPPATHSQQDRNIQKAELVIQTGHSSGVWSVAFSPDGKTLAGGSDAKTIRLWNVETGQERPKIRPRDRCYREGERKRKDDPAGDRRDRQGDRMIENP